MMKRNAIYAFIIVFSVFSLLPSPGVEEEVIGIVLTIKGNLVQKRNDSVNAIFPGDKIYKESVIELEEGSSRAKIQIGSESGPVIYTRFPVKFDKTNFNQLSPDQQDNYIACIGGTILTSRSVTLFNWFMNNLGALEEKDIKSGFSVVFSKNKNSKESLILDPLYFRLKDDVNIKAVTAKLINKDENNRVEAASLVIEKKSQDWIIPLDQFEYEYAVEYAVKATVIYMNNKQENTEFSFYVYGAEEIAYIETEARELYSEDVTSFQKAVIRAGRYRYYEMHLKGMSILKEAGIDIDGML